MRKVLVLGFVLISVGLLSFLSVMPLERRVLNPDGTTLAAATKPTQVEVTNFPAVQNVAGTVAVGNLPLDAQGNLRISGDLKVSPLAPHYVGITQASLPATMTTLELSRACNSEFPGTRLCDLGEIFRGIPPPDAWPSRYVWLMLEVTGGQGYSGLHFRACFDSASTSNPISDCNSPGPLPAACCGI